MLVAVAVGVVCVVLLATTVVVRWLRRPGPPPLDPAAVALSSEPAISQIRILRSAEELDEAIQRASTTEQTLQAMASKRAARYSRFGGRDASRVHGKDPRPRSAVTRLRIGDDPTPPSPESAEPGI